MSRTPRKEITRSNGHGRAPRFAGVRAHVGTLVLTGAKGQKRADLMTTLDKIAKGVKPVIDSEVKLADFHQSLEKLENRRVFGKIVVRF